MDAVRQRVLVERRQPHSGTGYSVLGFYNYASGSDYQTVSIPSAATANLTFWLNITTARPRCDAVRPLFAEVRNTSGTLLSTLGSWTNAT